MKQQEKTDLWVRAAVVGGLWASMEVIVGSFLHNVRIPFAGSILAFSGTVLLLGFYSIWPVKGLIWRAGLITALMKSISPSAIILGPMTGIMLEALLIEAVLWVGGQRLVFFMIAGILSISSALLHKVISLLIFYGFNLIKVYINLVNFGLKQVGIPAANGWQMLYALLVFYVLFGVLSGWLGKVIGKKAMAMRSSNIPFTHRSKPPEVKDFFEIREGQQAYMILVLVHTVAIPIGLFLLNYTAIGIGMSFIILYMIFFGVRYRYSLRRLQKPIFWSQLVVIVFLSAFFWEKGGAFHFSEVGFFTGLAMMLRALFIVVAFTGLSVELRNTKVRDALYKAGFGQFYRSVSMAFGALPAMIGLLPTSREILRYPIKSLLRPLVMADAWLLMFREKQQP